jgi:pteridine reductase
MPAAFDAAYAGGATPDMKIDGARILVTGGARRVGRAIVQELAARGAHVLVHYNRSHSEAEELIAALRADGLRADAVRADLSRPHEIAGFADALPPVDVLVNNAAIFPRTPLEQIDYHVWEQVLAVNQVSPALLAVSLGRKMAAAGGGAIVNITDCGVARPYRNHLPYLVSKAALEMLTRALAVELAPQVRVNAVAPATVLPPADMPATTVEALARRTLLGRAGAPADVVRAVVYLIENDFVTGATITVDGGATLRP